MIDYSWDFKKEEFNLDLDFFNEKDQEDKLWQARTGLNTDTLCGAIETIIFMSDRPVNLLKIKTQIDNDLPLRVVHESIARLQEEYEAKHHGIRLMEIAEGYQFRTKATHSKIISVRVNIPDENNIGDTLIIEAEVSAIDSVGNIIFESNVLFRFLSFTKFICDGRA